MVPPVLRRIVQTVNERLEEKADAELSAKGLVSNEKEDVK